MSDDQARKKQLARMHERTSKQPEDLFFNVFANPSHYPIGEASNTVGRHLECIDQVMTNFWEIDVARKQPNAKIPTKAHESDAGWDLYACESKTIQINERETINTGIALAIPKSFVGLIWPRSGLAVKRGIDVFAGVIDAGYRGEIKICLYNSSGTTVEINSGDRVAQIIFHKLPETNMLEVDDLEDSERGVGGFGSSGV